MTANSSAAWDAIFGRSTPSRGRQRTSIRTARRYPSSSSPSYTRTVSIGAERTRAALAHAPERGDISPYDAHMSVEAGQRRLLGLDLPTIGPALLVLALAGVMSLVLPSIDSRTSYSNAVRRGDVVRLAAGITLVP